MKYPAHPLLTDSLVITKPIALRARWPVAAAITLHAAAAGGVLAHGFFTFEKLTPPEMHPKNAAITIPVLIDRQPHGSPNSGNGGGGGNPNAGVKQPEIKVPRDAHQPIPPQPPSAPVAEPAPVEEGNGNGTVPGPVGTGNNPDGEPGFEGKGNDTTKPPGDGNDSAIVLPYDVTDPPTVVSRVEPVYPETARTTGTEGRVVVQFIIEADGSVSDIQILESSHGIFREPALQAARRWTFTGAAKDGRRVRTYKKVIMQFKLH